jgi:tetratricopeptide (TPR) repeat protein
MRRFLIPVLLALAMTPAFAAPSFVDDKSLDDAQRYRSCLDLVRNDANTAFELAQQWHDAGGGAGAEHCTALALVQMKSYNAAAAKLDQIARERDVSPDMRAELLDQAGNAWLLAGQPENAIASFSAAINLGANDADVLSDRARARGMLKDWAGADTDLTAALAKDQYRADLFVLRASARHAMGKKAEAQADIAHALDVDPHYADALVERGAMKLEDGDKAGARADWQIVLATQPNSPAADSARERIEQLELGQKSSPPRKAPPSTRH